ncbi:hypothetical protein AMAG_01447 [Allomyces macrogynus ATCC 38327]|uniref:Uncharacterized protein n=1 Tax=Allomyces macrogynus (strain ATCC 38327) TaxID=578462 RepID=A0A0L0RYU6_ALLM3|nr:hypothetical protein AMAG_01447 [Allomyces macrogynus ATCC 38327]|eukprot:KNE55557.1 hypothetical protein AMAG_01447 [Allomyces macrogynus ATCC 38327]
MQSSTISRPGHENKAGAVVAILASIDLNLTAKGEFEYLTFGALTSTTKMGLTMTSLVAVSDALVTSGSKIPIDRLTTHMTLTSIEQTCTLSHVPVGTFDLNKMIDVTRQASVSGYMVASSSRPFAWAARRAGAVLSHCRINMMDLVPKFPGSCGQTYRVRCLDPSVMVDAAEQIKLDPSSRTEPRPLLSMGLLSRWWGGEMATDGPSTGWTQNRLGVTNSGGLFAHGSASYPSWTDPNGPQQCSMYAVRVEVWELVVGIMTAALDFPLPQLYDTIIMQLFLYPHFRRAQERTNA